jgi:hypothetical protein
MPTTRIRTLGSLLFTLLIAAAFMAPDDAFAKKKRKKKRGNKDKSALVDSEPQEPETPEQAEARERYTKGKAFYDEKKFDEALAEFQAAYEAKSHPTVLKSIAECHVQLGDIAAAIETLQKYVDAPEATEKETVEARITELKNMPIKVSVKSNPEGAKIAVAGTQIDEVTPAKIELAAGEYIITLSAEGFAPVSRSLAVKLEGPNELSIDFAAEAAAAKQPEPEADALADPFAGEEETPAEEGEEVEEDEDDGLPNAFWACAAITGVGLVSGTVFGTMALGDEDDYKHDPKPETKEAGERDAIIADVSFGVAGAAAVVGIIILVTSRKKNKEKSESGGLRVLPVAGKDQLGVNAAITF